MALGEEYLKELKKRAKESRVHREFQLTGLEIADLLRDRKHKSLYIKLAKEHRGQELLRLAKEIAGRKGVKNRGAYFMAVVAGQKRQPQREIYRSKPAKKKNAE